MKYSKASRGHKSCHHDPDHRAQLGHRLRAARCAMGWSVGDAAKYFQVTERTWHNWEIGAHRIPFAVYKLCRVLSNCELPGDAWAGWSFQGGGLMTPEGRIIKPHEGSWWTLMVRSARLFHTVYRENIRLARELEVVRLAQAGIPAQAERDAGPVATGAPPGAAGRAAKPTAPNLLLEHLKKIKNENGVKPSFVATNTIANYRFSLASTNKGGFHGLSK